MLARKPVLPVMVVCCVLAGWLVWASVPALAAAPEAPEVSVEASVQATTATVHGVLNPHAAGEAGSYEFLYKEGNAGCVGGSKAPVPSGLATGVQGEGVSEVLSSLKPDTEYSVCLRVENTTHQEALSPTATFMTLPEAPVLESAEAQGSTVVVLKGELNPNGAKGKLSYQFDYNTNGTCTGGQSTPAVEVAEGMQDQVEEPHAQELEPNEQYTFCLVATNASGGQASSNEISEQTGRQAPAISEVSVASITSGEATVSAHIYPHGEQATYHVEYGTSEAYGSSTPEVSVSAQHGPAGIQARLSDLASGTEYHYRIVASNATGTERTSDATFMTEAVLAKGASGLPDDRVYEMVTPVNNNDANVYVPFTFEPDRLGQSNGFETFSLFQVAADGSAVTYLASPIPGAYGLARDGAQYLAERSSSRGWAQTLIQPPARVNTLYSGFSSDLSIGVLNSGATNEPEVLPPLSSEAPGKGYFDLYECAIVESPCTTSEDTTSRKNPYQPLYTTKITLNRPPVAPGEQGLDGKFGTNGGAIVNGRYTNVNLPLFAGGSANFTDLVFEANDALLAGEGSLERELESDVKREIANGEDSNYLYDSVQGSLSLIDVSPAGKVVPGATFGGPPLGYRANESPPGFSHTISADGNRAYWSSIETLSNSDEYVTQELPTGLYLRENPGRPQSPVEGTVCTVPADACTVQVAAGPAQYWTASENGRYAFYTEAGGLYRFDAEPGDGREARETLAGTSAGVLGVLGASKDGETVYFVAEGALAGANGEGVAPVQGQSNLYVLTPGGHPVFVATLSGADGSKVEPYSSDSNHSEAGFGDWVAGLGAKTARVTADGGSVVFMSSQANMSVVGYPRGYPNNGAEEIYVYDASSNQLRCASCGSTSEGASGFLPISWNSTYLPQWISEDGDRVFFDSNSRLVPQDTNGQQDVYEWEAEGTGTCADGTGVNGGCVSLLSGGTSESYSWLIGASETGNDVIIVTRADLVPEDQYEDFELYDVRADGVKPLTPAACNGTGCQGVPSPPPTFATPSSVTFDGVGNFAAPVPTAAVKSKAKTLTRAQKLANALKACSKDKQKKRRVTCETRARKRYGARKASKAKGRTVKKSAKGRK
jgi:hypothetical protein